MATVKTETAVDRFVNETRAIFARENDVSVAHAVHSPVQLVVGPVGATGVNGVRTTDVVPRLHDPAFARGIEDHRSHWESALDRLGDMLNEEDKQ